MTSNPAALRLHNRHTGEILEISREQREGELVFRLSGTLPPHRQGPPRHIHYLEDEEGIVVSGTLSAELDGQHLTFGPGERVTLPRGVPHRSTRVSRTGLRCSIWPILPCAIAEARRSLSCRPRFSPFSFALSSRWAQSWDGTAAPSGPGVRLGARALRRLSLRTLDPLRRLYAGAADATLL
jgi:quercetin dioxygenase-like cupin family protein